MENKKESPFVTHLELELAQSKMRSDMKREVRIVDDKIDNLKELVLPMIESSKQTAENTKKIGDLMERFTDEQRKTNGKFHDKLHVHDLNFSEINGKFDAVGNELAARTEEKKNNTALWSAILAVIAAIVTGIFQLAPSFFN